MALVVKDRVRETSVTQGTGTFTLAGAVTGYQSFSAIGNGNTTYYTIYLQASNEWEVGIGTYTASGTTLSRDTILASSNGGSVVNFSAGTKDVFVTYPAGRSVYYDTATNVTVNQLSATTVDATNVEVTNIKAKDGTAALSIADSTGAVTVSSAFAANGGATLGDASGDALTINSSAVSTPNGLNFDSDTFVIDATNNRVGIGTSSPTNKLDVSTDAVIRAGTGGTPSTGGTLWLTTGSSTGGVRSAGIRAVSTGAANSHDLVFLTNGDSAAPTERARITSGGQLNLGGNFTSTNNTLQVTGNAAIGYTTAAPTTGLIVAGNVGIGTDSPGAKLEVNTGSTADATSIVLNNTSNAYPAGYNGSTSIYAKGYAYQSFAQENIGRIQFALDSAFDSGWSSSIRLYTSNSRGSITERARIDSSGTLILRQSSNAANTSVSFNTTVQNALTLDSSGNLGLGVTPSAWLTWKAMQVGSRAAFVGNSTASFVANNFYYDGADGRYIASATAALYEQSAGTHKFFTAASGTAGNIISFTQAMTLHASGGLSIGNTNDPGTGNVIIPASGTIYGNTVSGQRSYIELYNGSTGNMNLATTFFSGAITFSTGTGPTERARITSVGGFETRPAATGHAVFNEDGVDADFRVESDSDTHCLFVDASANNVGIGTSSPGAKLDVSGLARANAFGMNATGGTPATGIAAPASDTLGLYTNTLERARITSGGVFQVSSGGSVQVGGTAARATTAGTNRLDIFDGTAPVGTLTNGISIYSSSGEAYVMDAAGNATLFSPHDAETNEWIFKSKHTPTGKVLKIDVEKLLRFINDHFGLDAVHEFIEE